MADSARVNGVTIGWSSISQKIDGAGYSGGTDIEYGDGVEQTQTYGMGKHYGPRGRTRGKYSCKPYVFTAFVATAREIRAAIAAKAGTKGISNYPVQIVLQFIEPDDGQTVTVEAFDCTLTDNEGSHSEGPDGLMEKLTFQPLRMKRNGIALYDTSTAGA